MDIDYDIEMDDFDSADYIEYADDFYSRDTFDCDYVSQYWQYED